MNTATRSTIDPFQRVIGGPEPWLRYDAELVGVNFPDRTIEIIVIPYEHEIEVQHPTKRGGPMVKEVITRGAFDGIERRANRVRANREHQKILTFGRATAFHPAHEHGLHAEIRCAQTELGEETLQLADDGCLDASAGFWPELDDRGRFAGMRWENPNRYRITKAFLDHISLVSDGAYGEKAGVLAVRAAAAAQAPVPLEVPGTPVLDALHLDTWRQQLDAIDAKYIRT